MSRYGIAVCLFVGAFFVLLWGARTQGITRDEAYYFRAAEEYARLPGDLGRGMTLAKAVQRDFSYNHEHPALMKELFGASHALLGRWLGPILAFRIPTVLLVAALMVLVYAFGATLGDRRAGLLAAPLALFQPHFYYHAGLACFDAPVAVFWFAVVYAYYRSIISPARVSETGWAIATGILFGLSQGVKFNTLFLPPVLLAHWIYTRLRGGRPSPWSFVAMATLGPLVFFLHWPWIWFETVARVKGYLAFHLHHWHYNFEFLGRNYNDPPYPLSVPWVGTALTVPAVTLLLALGALVAAAAGKRLLDVPEQERDGRPLALLAANVAAPLVVLNLPSAPIFGGVKHFLAAMPFLALLAGLGLSALLAAAAGPHPRRNAILAGGLALCTIGPAALETLYAHPNGISYYNAIAGGFAGGADLGMNRQFWGASPRGLFDWMNRTLPPGARVYFHDLNYDSFAYYKRAGLLRPDIVYTGLEEPAIRGSDVALVIHEKHFQLYENLIWQNYGTTQPVRILAREGVPLVTVYARDRPAP